MGSAQLMKNDAFLVQGHSGKIRSIGTKKCESRKMIKIKRMIATAFSSKVKVHETETKKANRFKRNKGGKSSHLLQVERMHANGVEHPSVATHTLKQCTVER